MEQNVYAPPKAYVEDQEVYSAPDYYVVSPKKFLILFLVTVGFYSFYWFYKNWKLHKAKTAAPGIPFLRAVFPVFFTHSLFRAVARTLQEKNIEHLWNPSSLATWYVVLTVVRRIADRLSTSGAGSTVVQMMVVLTLPIVALPLYHAQKAINAASGDPDGESNGNLTGANICWLLFGGFTWLMMGLGWYEALSGKLLFPE